MVMYARTQWCVEADAHQVKPVLFQVISSVEDVRAPFKRFFKALCDQPVVRLGVGGVNNSSITFKIHKHLDDWMDKDILMHKNAPEQLHLQSLIRKVFVKIKQFLQP